jgi:predicted RNase H-like HicB family nuclease
MQARQTQTAPRFTPDDPPPIHNASGAARKEESSDLTTFPTGLRLRRSGTALARSFLRCHPAGQLATTEATAYTIFMSEIIFDVQEDEVDGGYVATALGHGIVTQGDTLNELREMVKGAVRCHFGDGVPGPMPKIIRLHFVRDEVMAV